MQVEYCRHTLLMKAPERISYKGRFIKTDNI